jgi:hypothetical protein
VDSTPPEAQTDKNVKASVEEPSLKDFVLEYILTVASDDVSAQERFFADRVNFYGEEDLSLPKIQGVHRA